MPADRLIEKTARLIEKFGQAVSFLALFMVLITFVVVILRYSFGIGWIWLQEIVIYMHATLFMLGVSLTMLHDEHVRVDIRYEKLSAKKRLAVDRWGIYLFTIPCCLGLFWISIEYVAFSWRVLEESSETGGLPGVFLLKSLLLVAPILFLITSILYLKRREKSVQDQMAASQEKV